jgi:hypothetical protein
MTPLSPSAPTWTATFGLAWSLKAGPPAMITLHASPTTRVPTGILTAHRVSFGAGKTRKRSRTRVGDKVHARVEEDDLTVCCSGEEGLERGSVVRDAVTLGSG